MRPRPEGRGEPERNTCLACEARWLQCGHDPKAVENQAAHWRAGGAAWPLQCGHDPKAVENPWTRASFRRG